jgi:hypothetical protein
LAMTTAAAVAAYPRPSIDLGKDFICDPSGLLRDQSLHKKSSSPII